MIGTCDGDSGGPLACRSTTDGKWVLIGILSFGPQDCSSRDAYSVYTRVSSYVNWINNKITITIQPNLIIEGGAGRGFLDAHFLFVEISVLTLLIN